MCICLMLVLIYYKIEDYPVENSKTISHDVTGVACFITSSESELLHQGSVRSFSNLLGIIPAMYNERHKDMLWRHKRDTHKDMLHKFGLDREKTRCKWKTRVSVLLHRCKKCFTLYKQLLAPFCS